MLAVLVNLTCLDVSARFDGRLQEHATQYKLSITKATYAELCYVRLFSVYATSQDLPVSERLTDADVNKEYNCVARWQAVDTRAPAGTLRYGYDKIRLVETVPFMGPLTAIYTPGLRLLFTHEYMAARGWITHRHLDNAAYRTAIAVPGVHPLLFSVPVTRFQAFAKYHTLPTFEDIPAAALARLTLEYTCAHCGNTVAQIPTQSEPCPVRPGQCEWLNRLVE